MIEFSMDKLMRANIKSILKDNDIKADFTKQFEYHGYYIDFVSNKILIDPSVNVKIYK
jgi:hypothetical protein